MHAKHPVGLVLYYPETYQFCLGSKMHGFSKVSLILLRQEMQREQVAAKDNDEKLRNETEEASLELVHCHGSHTPSGSLHSLKPTVLPLQKMVVKMVGDPAVLVGFWPIFRGISLVFREV